MNTVRVERPEELKRTQSISVALTSDDKRRIIDAAHSSGYVVSEFVRRSTLAEVEKVEKRQERERGAGK